MGFIRSISDQVVYTLGNKECKLLVGVDVVDLIISGSHTEDIESFKS